MSFWPPPPHPIGSIDEATLGLADHLWAELKARDKRLTALRLSADHHVIGQTIGEPVLPRTLTPGDPWMRMEAWRFHPYFGGWSRLRRTMPGLGIATAAFALYCLAGFKN